MCVDPLQWRSTRIRQVHHNRCRGYHGTWCISPHEYCEKSCVFNVVKLVSPRNWSRNSDSFDFWEVWYGSSCLHFCPGTQWSSQNGILSQYHGEDVIGTHIRGWHEVLKERHSFKHFLKQTNKPTNQPTNQQTYIYIHNYVYIYIIIIIYIHIYIYLYK